MRNFNENGVMFTENEKMQIVNTINGFRGITTNGYSREFVVGNVKFRVIINSITGGYDANVAIECAVKGANGRYGNMQSYSYTIISKGQVRRVDWKLEIMNAFYKDIFADVDSNDVAPVAEANENQNQVENNATIFNTPNLDEVVDKVNDILIKNDLGYYCGNLCIVDYDDGVDCITILNNGSDVGATAVAIPDEITDEFLYSLAKYYTIIDDLNSYNVRYDCEQFNFEIFSSKTKVNEKLEFTEGKDWYEGLMKNTIDEYIKTITYYLINDKL